MWLRSAALAITLLALQGLQPAMAQALCLEHATLVKQLGQKYSEAPVAMGLSNNGRTVIELFTSAKGDTWSLVRTLPNGTSCLIAGGDSWFSITPPVAAIGDGS